MIFRLLLATCAAWLFAGCAVPLGQIRNGRFVSDSNGSVRVTNQIISFDVWDLPPGSRVKRKVLYRLLPDDQVDFRLRHASEYRTGIGAYIWRLEDDKITATGRLDPSPMAVFYRPTKRRPAPPRPPVEIVVPPVEIPRAIPVTPDNRPVPILIN